MDKDIKISSSAFEKYILHSENHVWYGIIKRPPYNNHKHTKAEWFGVIEQLKTGKAGTK